MHRFGRLRLDLRERFIQGYLEVATAGPWGGPGNLSQDAQAALTTIASDFWDANPDLVHTNDPEKDARGLWFGQGGHRFSLFDQTNRPFDIALRLASKALLAPYVWVKRNDRGQVEVEVSPRFGFHVESRPALSPRSLLNRIMASSTTAREEFVAGYLAAASHYTIFSNRVRQQARQLGVRPTKRLDAATRAELSRIAENFWMAHPLL